MGISRAGYKLTEDAEDMIHYHSSGSCQCRTSPPPCSWCTDTCSASDALEVDEYWEIDEERWELSPNAKTMASTVERWLGRGWTLASLIEHKHLILKEDPTMSREDVKNLTSTDDMASSKFEYAIGTKVKIISNAGGSREHFFKIGSFATIDSLTSSGRYRLLGQIGGGAHCQTLDAEMFEPYLGDDAQNKYDPPTQDAKVHNQEEVTMSSISRRVVNIKIFDEDKGLPVEHSLVFTAKDVITEDSNEECFREILMNTDVAERLEAHNETRSGVINQDILERTGNEVMLAPVKLKDLRVEITPA